MSAVLRFLVAESEPAQARAERRASVGRSGGETFADLLARLAPGARIERIEPADDGGDRPPPAEIESYDAVFLTGSPLHLWQETVATRREIALMRAVFAAGVPAFGSCAGLQLATVAAGGTVRPMRARREAGFARRLTPTEAGRGHPLLAGRPPAFDAPAIHSDEVERLPEGARSLATNAVTRVQAAEIRCGPGVFWGVQYHPEIDLGEVAGALRRQKDDLVDQGLAGDEQAVEAQAALIEALHHAPERRDLAWRLGLDEEVTDPARRSREIANFLEHLVLPTRSARGRG